MDIDCVSSVANDLGESPLWDPDSRRLYWIDAWRSEVHAFDPTLVELIRDPQHDHYRLRAEVRDRLLSELLIVGLIDAVIVS